MYSIFSRTGKFMDGAMSEARALQLFMAWPMAAQLHFNGECILEKVRK